MISSAFSFLHVNNFFCNVQSFWLPEIHSLFIGFRWKNKIQVKMTAGVQFCAAALNIKIFIERRQKEQVKENLFYQLEFIVNLRIRQVILDVK